MKKFTKKIVATLLAAVMVLAMGVTAFAATPGTCKFTKTDGTDLKLNMGTAVIESCDLTNGVATVVFTEYSLLGYTGEIIDITGDAVQSWDENSCTAVINMGAAQSVPVTIEFEFSLGLTPPGMDNPMDALFVCY